MPEALPKSMLEVFKRQKYQLVGSHSAVKKCRWLHQSLVYGRACYKQLFYGIQTHRCIQMTPTLACNMRCVFCWRIQPEDMGVRWDSWDMSKIDDPKTIVDGCIGAQRKILSGYKNHVLSGRLSGEKYQEALSPKHAAVSLDGEPTLFPQLQGLLEEYRKRGFTTFLVSNGTMPETLAKLSIEPSQLYVSLYGPDERTFLKACRPHIPNAWERVKKTLDLIPSFKNPTVVRLTLVRGVNLKNSVGYAKLIKNAAPVYIEAKAYVYVGYSRKRLQFENMPSHEEIKGFSVELARELSYNILAESSDSRVVLLSKLQKPISLAG